MKKHLKENAIKPMKHTDHRTSHSPVSSLRSLTQAVVPAPDGGYPGFNTAEGQNALFGLTTGQGNTAVGWFSLRSNTDGSFNTGVGAGTLLFNVGDQGTGEGVNNTALGTVALLFNTTGSENTATGIQALFSNTDGAANTARVIKRSRSTPPATRTRPSGSKPSLATPPVPGTRLLVLGHSVSTPPATSTQPWVLTRSKPRPEAVTQPWALVPAKISPSGNNNIDIGNSGVAGDSDTTRIGFFQTRTFISGIRGVTTGNANAIPVLIDSDGQLGTASSSRRFKKEIKPMDKASEAILALKPVTFRYNSDARTRRNFV